MHVKRIRFVSICSILDLSSGNKSVRNAKKYQQVIDVFMISPKLPASTVSSAIVVGKIICVDFKAHTTQCSMRLDNNNTDKIEKN